MINRRKFVTAALTAPIALYFPFAWAAQKPPQGNPHQVNYFYRGVHITFTGDGPKVIADIRDLSDHQLAMITQSGDGDLSLDRWFFRDSHNPSLINYPDNKRLNALKFSMERTIDRMRDV